MKFNIQTKLFLLLAGLTSLVLIVVLIAINTIVSETITQDVISNFEQTQGFFQNAQSLKYDRLVESAYLIQENSTFKANVGLNDPSSMEVVVENQFAPFIKADLFVVTNEKGKVLSWLGNEKAAGTDISDRMTIKKALRGAEPALEVTQPDLWAVEGQLFQVVSIPIFTRNNIIGTITLGTKFTQVEAKELKQNTPLDVAIFLDDEPVTGSGGAIPTEGYKTIIRNHQALVDSILANQVATPPFEDTNNGEDYFIFLSPLGVGEPAFYIASVPVALELQILRKIQKNILLIALALLIGIIPAAIFLGSIISGPINSLTKAMLKVRKGKLDVSVESKSNDEIGILAQSFNEMIGGLRERFALQKYVGGHTMEMIKMNRDGDVKLGGIRREMAIIFCDIRGSTRKIATSDPEEFVSELNKCLSYQSEYVEKYKGSIDKFVGDEVIALFDGNDALERAIKCAVDIQKRFKEESVLTPFFDGLGIGINYGLMVLGNMGANERMDYTVIGPEVNLCARLCSGAKTGQILLPAQIITRCNLNNGIRFNPADQQKFKGFSKPLDLVEVCYA